YTFFAGYQPTRWSYLGAAGIAALGVPLLFIYLWNRYGRIPLAGAVGIVMLGFVPNYRFGLYTFGERDLLMVPGTRMRLDSPSVAIEKIRATNSNPFRIVSAKQSYAGSLSGDYSAVYDLEDIRSCGPMANSAYISLLRSFPGMDLASDWVIGVKDINQAQPLLSFLNVRYVLARPDEPLNAENFKTFAKDDFLVLENQQAWPKAYFVNNVGVATTPDELVACLKGASRPFATGSKDAMRQSPELQALQAISSSGFQPATEYIL